MDSKASKLEVNVQDEMVVGVEDIKSKLLTQFKGDKDLVAGLVEFIICFNKSSYLVFPEVFFPNLFNIIC